MKPVHLLALAAAACCAGCANQPAATNPSPESTPPFEWQVIPLHPDSSADANASARAILLNQRTGETWIILPRDVQSWWKKMERKD